MCITVYDINSNTESLLTGSGFGLIHLPATVSVATYFDKKRAIATGIATTGLGFGAFTFAPIINLLGDHFGWSWTLMMIGGVVIICIPVSLPLNGNKSNQSSDSWKESCQFTDIDHPDVNCFGCIPISAVKIGRGYTHLLYDTKFLLFLLSILLMNIGFAAPYAYTVVSRQYTCKIDIKSSSSINSILSS